MSTKIRASMSFEAMVSEGRVVAVHGSDGALAAHDAGVVGGIKAQMLEMPLCPYEGFGIEMLFFLVGFAHGYKMKLEPMNQAAKDKLRWRRRGPQIIPC